MKPRVSCCSAVFCFSRSARDFLEVYGIDDLRVRYFYDSFVDREHLPRTPEVIVLSQVLPDPINTYVEEFKNSIVSEVNGHVHQAAGRSRGGVCRAVGLLRDPAASARDGPSCSNVAPVKPPGAAHQDRSTTSCQRSRTLPPPRPRRRTHSPDRSFAVERSRMPSPEQAAQPSARNRLPGGFCCFTLIFHFDHDQIFPAHRHFAPRPACLRRRAL